MGEWKVGGKSPYCEHFGDEAVADLITTMEYMSRQDLDALILELKLLQPEIN